MSEKDDSYLQKIVTIDGELKCKIVDYVGEKLNPEKGEVTLEMVVVVMAEEFPELLLSIAEENFLKGYEKGLNDLDILNLDN
jgi:hypothetical protein